MTTEVLNTVAKALNGSLTIFFDVIDGLQARDYLFGALVVITIFRLLLMPLIGGRHPNEINLSSSVDKVHVVGSSKKDYDSKKKNDSKGDDK